LFLKLTSGAAFCVAAAPGTQPASMAAPYMQPGDAARSAVECPWIDPTCQDGVHRG
jgi:hypothetical protein